MLRELVLAAIARYQRLGGGSRLFGVSCTFTPTCSEYTRQAVARDGALRGIRLGIARVARCCERNRLEPLPDPLPPRGRPEC